jgi:hypothetical protein
MHPILDRGLMVVILTAIYAWVPALLAGFAREHLWFAWGASILALGILANAVFVFRKATTILPNLVGCISIYWFWWR